MAIYVNSGGFLPTWHPIFDQLLVHMDIYHVIAYQRPPPGAVTIHKIYTDQRLNGDQDSVRIHNQMPMCSQHTKTLILANRHKKLSGNEKKTCVNVTKYNGTISEKIIAYSHILARLPVPPQKSIARKSRLIVNLR